MKVKAAAGTKCPMEGKPRKYITDSKEVEVADSPYYLRLVRDGSLVISESTASIRKKKEE